MENQKLFEIYKVMYGADAERRLKEDLNDLTEESHAKIYRIVQALLDDKVKMLANFERIQNDFRESREEKLAMLS